MTEAQEEVVAEIGDVRDIVGPLDDDLNNAECCETGADLIANIENAIARIDAARIELKRLLSDARKGAKVKS